MAAPPEQSVANMSAGEADAGDVFGDDPRSDGKKKKFKPFQKMRNFFRGGSSKKRFKVDDGVGQKAHSTSVLQGDDDDEGGFRQGPQGLAGSRSISEDSIFKPDEKKSPIGVLQGQTVSMEGINDFKTELFSKLKGRQSDSSDLDEGLPYSPAFPSTPSNPMFDSLMLKQATPAGGRSTSRESDKSLISVDGSDEDLFSAPWKSSIASVKTSRTNSGSMDSLTDTPMEASDLDAVQVSSSSALKNEAAKHRISVKPKSRRLSSKMSLRQREKPTVNVKLPDVKEEFSKGPLSSDITMTRSLENISDFKQASSRGHKTVISTTIPIGSPSDSGVNVIPRSDPRSIPVSMRPSSDPDASRPRSMSPISTSPVSSSMLHDVKLRPRPQSGKFESAEVKKDTDTSGNELSKAFNKAKRFSKKYDEDGNVVDSNAAKLVNKDVEKDSAKKAVNKDVEKDSAKKAVNKDVEKDSAKKAVNKDVEKDSAKKAVNKDVEKDSAKKAVNKDVEKDSAKKAVTSPKNIVLLKEELKASTTTASPAAVSPTSPTMTNVSFVLKKEPLRPASKIMRDTRTSVTEQKESIKTTKPSLATKPETVSSPPKEVEVKKDTDSESNVNKSLATSPESSPQKLASPRDDYRVKRQIRSKTLPVSKEMVDKAEEADATQSKVAGRAGSPPLLRKNRAEYDNVALGSQPFQSKRSSWASPSTATSQKEEPSWAVRARLKRIEAESKSKTNESGEGAKEVKVEVKSSQKVESQSSNDSKLPEKGTTEVKPVASSVEKASNSTTSASSVRSWSHSHTAKPFEKPSVQSNSAKPISSLQTGALKGSFEKPSVQSSAAVQSTAGKSAATSTAKPTTPSTTKPNFDKPLSQSAKTAFDGKASQGIGKTNAVERSFSQKSASASSKTVTESSKPVVASSKSGVDSYKPSVGSAKFGLDSKPVVSGVGTKPLGSTNTKTNTKDPIKPSVSSVSSDSKKTFSPEHKKVVPDATKKDTISNSSSTALSSTSKQGNLPKTGSAGDRSAKQETSGGGSVPAWKQALNQKKNPATQQQVKIEIIDKTGSSDKPAQSKVEEKQSGLVQKAKPATEKCSDIAGNRPSKVLDMVKSFQKLQVT